MTFLGINDITNPIPGASYDEDSHTDLLIRYALHFHQRYYELGARRIGLLNLPATGCVPGLRIIEGGIPRECSERINRRIRLFNSKLGLAVEKMNKEFPGERVVLFDLYNPVLSLVQNPASYGIEEVKFGCCGTGNLEAGVFCAVPGTCSDAFKVLVLGQLLHPSEKAAKIMTYQSFTPNLSELVQ